MTEGAPPEAYAKAAALLDAPEPFDEPDVTPSVDPRDVIDMEAVAECAGLDHSDTDNGKRLIRHFGRDLVVRRQEGGRSPLYVAWTGSHWDDMAGAAGALRLAQRVGPRIAAEAEFIEPTESERRDIEAAAHLRGTKTADLSEADKELREAALAAQKRFDGRRAARRKFAVSSKNAARVSAMLAMAAPHLLVPPEAFNADPLRLATVRETLQFRREPDPENPDPDGLRHVATLDVIAAHRREDMITRLLPYPYEPGATCPKWRAFMERFQPHEASRRFVQVAWGLGLLGLTEQVLVFHYGEGANGKSVALEVISRVLGPLAVSLPAESISGENQRGGAAASPDIARLFGARFVRVAEMPEGTPLQEDLVKKLTGGERFPVRNLFEGFFEFEPVFIAHMSGNGYPRIGGTDNGIWRRMAVVKWPVVLAPHEQRNFADVVDEMVAEAPGILAWLVEGALIYLREGLVRPESVIDETRAFRDEMDPVGRFFAACVRFTGNEADMVAGRDMYGAYVAWAEASGSRPVSETRFGRDAAKKAKREDGRIRLYRGVQLHDVPPRSPSSGHDGGADARWERQP